MSSWPTYLRHRIPRNGPKSPTAPPSPIDLMSCRCSAALNTSRLAVSAHLCPILHPRRHSSYWNVGRALDRGSQAGVSVVESLG
jgi:hypothetical protein